MFLFFFSHSNTDAVHVKNAATKNLYVKDLKRDSYKSKLDLFYFKDNFSNFLIYSDLIEYNYEIQSKAIYNCVTPVICIQPPETFYHNLRKKYKSDSSAKSYYNFRIQTLYRLAKFNKDSILVELYSYHQDNDLKKLSERIGIPLSLKLNSPETIDCPRDVKEKYEVYSRKMRIDRI